MKNIEQFDKWVQDKLNALDSPPVDFATEAVWQKIQAHLSKEETRLSIQRKTSQRYKYGVAAVFGLLVTLGVVSIWYITSTKPNSIVSTQKSASPNTAVFIPDIIVKEETTSHKRLDLRTQSQKQTLVVENTQSEVQLNSFGEEAAVVPFTESPSTALEIPPTENSPVEIIQAIPLQVIAKNVKEKPKFKVVHVNNLKEYQQNELAEIRQKEAEKQGIVIINFPKKEEAAALTLKTYLHNKNSPLN
ncbi:MAG: hypothetical protein ACK4GN_12605 [Runella sp.]